MVNANDKIIKCRGAVFKYRDAKFKKLWNFQVVYGIAYTVI